MLGCLDRVETSNRTYNVPLNGVVMQLRRTELTLVAAGLGEFDSSPEGDLATLAAAVTKLKPNERASAWELAVRRFGRHKPLAQAAGEIGLDEVHARALLERFTHNLADVRVPEDASVEVPAAATPSEPSR